MPDIAKMVRRNAETAAKLVSRSPVATIILLAAMTGSIGAPLLALALLLFPSVFGGSLLATASLGCLATAGTSLLAGWWAIDDLVT